MENIKRIRKFEFTDMKDHSNLKVFHSNPHTEISIRSLETGEELFHGSNKVVGAGGDFVARHLFDIDPETSPIVFPTYNQELNLDDGGIEDLNATYDFTKATEENPKILLWCMGTDGCGTENSQIFTVDYNSRIAPDALIPFRYPMASNDLNDELQALYGGRKEMGNYTGYYFKRFTSGPTMYERYLDGTPIEGNVYDVGQEFEIFVETVLTLTKDEAREYFIATVGIDEAKFNSISLVQCYPKLYGGKLFYMNMRPVTKLNLSNESLIDVTKGVEIIYHTYF